MANARFEPGNEGFATNEICWTTGVIKLLAVRNYTFSASHKFLSDVTGAGGVVVATSPAFTTKTATLGVLDADDAAFGPVAAGPDITCGIILQTSAPTGGADLAATAQRLIYFIDNRFQVEIAVNAASAATSIVTEDLPADIADVTPMTLVSGSGPATITTSAVGALGARSLSVAALSSALTAGARYEYKRSGALLPFTPNTSPLTFSWDNGPFKIFKM